MLKMMIHRFDDKYQGGLHRKAALVFNLKMIDEMSDSALQWTFDRHIVLLSFS